MSIRKSLIKLSQRIEAAWQFVDFTSKPVALAKGWYITEFMVEGVLRSTPRFLVKQADGKTAERELIGAHSGRNRMLVYLPDGQLRAMSESIDVQLLARVPAWEGRARVLLICWRYLLDFFSPWTLLRMIAMQFRSPFVLSTRLLEFYSPPENSILDALDWWQRKPNWSKAVAWYLRGVTIGVLIEEDQQRDRLINMLCPPDQIRLMSEVQKADASALNDAQFWVVLNASEQLRSPAIIMLKLAVWRARRKGIQPSLVYTDHDYALNQSSPQHPEPVFKPNPSLAYLHCYNYVGPAVMFSADMLHSKAQKREQLSEQQSEQQSAEQGTGKLDEATLYQLALQAFAESERVVHVSELLFTSKRTTPLSTPAPSRAESAWPNIAWRRADNHNRLSAAETWREQPSVDIVIPTRDGLQFLEPCVTGLLENTDYDNFHVIIVDNGSELAQTHEWLDAIQRNERVSVVDYPGEFNFSAINNTAVAHGTGDYIALVNNDIEVIHADWLRQMMVWATQEQVGIVGAKLLFSNGLVQHAGVTVGMGNAAGHIHRLEAGDAPGYQNRCIATQNMMAVTAACFITPRTLYEQLGGLDEAAFKVAYNDIDYCLRVEALGLDVIWTPEAQLYHHESVSRGDDMSAPHIERYFKELSALQKRWKTKGFVDKYYNKHLRISDEGVYPQIDVAGEDPLREL